MTPDYISMFRSNIQALDAQMNEDNTRKSVEELNGKSCKRVLSELAEQFDEVDFRAVTGIDSDTRLTRKVFVTVAVDEVIRKATANNWGMCFKNDFIYLYNGRYWQPCNADDFKPFLTDAALRMGVAPLEARYYQFADEMYKQFVSVANLSTPERTPGVTLINLQNGTFEITENSQQLREQRREDFIKYQLPFSYDPNAKCPMFDKYLQRVLPDEACRKVLAGYMGYVFTNGLKLEKVAILYGDGANGKSVFFDIVNALIGRDNICTYSPQTLTKYDGYQRAELYNKLLNYASEIGSGIEPSLFKQLVSGEPVEVRHIYGRPFIMYDYGKLMFNCNVLPHETEKTKGYFRRFMIIPFDQTIPENEQDHELAAKIIGNELSGVFNWMLDGLNRILRQKKFTESEIIEAAGKEFEKESDSVAMFIDEQGYAPDTKNTALLKWMFDEYRTYCYECGLSPCAVKTFSKRLKTAGYDIKHTRNGNVVYALKLDELL